MLYFVPQLATMPRARAEKLGLGYAMADSGPEFTELLRGGPGGQRGVVFSWSGSNLRAADRARWERIPGREDLWLGVPSPPPAPAALERRRLVAGHEVELGDGQRWVIPVARCLDGSTPLPRRLAWDGHGWAPGDVVEQLRELWAQACRVWDTLAGCADESPVATLDDECGIASMALGINYRLGPAEISALGLLTTAVEVEVLKALVDLPALGLKKKLDSVGPSSGPGETGS